MSPSSVVALAVGAGAGTEVSTGAGLGADATIGSVADVLVAGSETTGCGSSARLALDPDRVAASVPVIARTAAAPAIPIVRMTLFGCEGFRRVREDDAEDGLLGFAYSVSGIASLRGRSSWRARA
jgi:hypothetical protein